MLARDTRVGQPDGGGLAASDQDLVIQRDVEVNESMAQVDVEDIHIGSLRRFGFESALPP